MKTSPVSIQLNLEMSMPTVRYLINTKPLLISVASPMDTSWGVLRIERGFIVGMPLTRNTMLFLGVRL